MDMKLKLVVVGPARCTLVDRHGPYVHTHEHKQAAARAR